jgi:hypothetical protein
VIANQVTVIGRRAACCHDDANPAVQQIGRQVLQPAVVIEREAVFDRNVAALDEAGLAQPGAKCRREIYVRLRREITGNRQCRLLRMRCERPGRRAT